MSFIVEQEGYQYAALAIATFGFVPQLYKSYKRKTMDDVSGYTIFLISTSAGLWAFYMYEKEYFYYTIATLFVMINTSILFAMKIAYYCIKLRDNYKSMNEPPAPFVVTPQV